MTPEQQRVAISECCRATTTVKENLRYDGEKLACIGTYRVCDKCRLACEYEWVNTCTEQREGEKS
jgi:hypothetical protein